MDNSEVARSRISERDMRQWLKRQLGATWHSFIEPAAGSTSGMPDLLLRFPGGHASDFLPVELKIAHFMRKDPERIRAEKIRALQVNWHANLSSSGGWSCFLLGVPGPAGFTAYVLASCGYGMLRYWQKGWFLNSLTCVARDDKLDIVAWEQAMEQWRAENDRPTPLGLYPTKEVKRLQRLQQTCMALGQPSQPPGEPTGAIKGLPS